MYRETATKGAGRGLTRTTVAVAELAASRWGARAESLAIYAPDSTWLVTVTATTIKPRRSRLPEKLVAAMFVGI